MRDAVSCYSFFFFNDTATTEIYTLSLHDALPIYGRAHRPARRAGASPAPAPVPEAGRSRARLVDDRRRCTRRPVRGERRSEEHTSELQSRQYLVCRLLLEKKKKTLPTIPSSTLNR